MEDPNTAVDNPELGVLVEVGHDAGDDPGDVQNVEDRDGDQGGGEETAEVPGFPVLDDDDQEEEIEEDGCEGDDRPADPPPGGAGDDRDFTCLLLDQGRQLLRNSASSFHWLSSSIFSCCSFVRLLFVTHR